MCFSFCNKQERKLGARFLKTKRSGISVIRKNGIKTDEIQSFTKKQNFVPTKYTSHTIVNYIWREKENTEADITIIYVAKMVV